ncbi:hypothetical protein GOP47_0002213 [Adiantum capillus-veneris]|uniref:RING-type E3 ubiquitin transferase n=1 Tax=Adiantum capillus-veneris TaxID=13818 RepID=A0A9D4V9R4_ADICA|nr:hypothetical protein GOP47_0002213 [Adiantum capillus-veneris]
MSAQVQPSLPPLAASSLSNPSSEGILQGQYTFNSKVMVAAMLILCIVVLFVISLHIYAKWFWHQGRVPLPLSNSANATWRRRLRLPATLTDTNETLSPTICIGLDLSTISSLPTFIYQASYKHQQHDANEPLLECAVCLSEFQPYEKGRILPDCKHSFHIGCIDMWFRSHSTCPLCRAPVSLWTPQHHVQNTGTRSDSTSQSFLLVLPTSHQQDEQTTANSMLQSTSSIAMNPYPHDQSTGITPPMSAPQGHLGIHVQGQHKKGFAKDIEELRQRYDIQVDGSETLRRIDGTYESSSTSASSVIIQGPSTSIARCQSLGMQRRQSEDTEVCDLRPIKSQSFRMSIRWLLSRDLSRGRGRIFPSAARDQREEEQDHQVEQSSIRSSLPL